MMALASTTILFLKDILVHVYLISMVADVKMIINLAKEILAGIMVQTVIFLEDDHHLLLISLGTCHIDKFNITFVCQCQEGWAGRRCESMINYCENITCENNGVCRPLLMNYTCECLGDSYSGRHCENIATKIVILQAVSKTFAYVAIIAMICVVLFIVIMDILKYGFGIDPVREERERLQREREARRRKPVIQRFVYVNKPTVAESSEETNTEATV